MPPFRAEHIGSLLRPPNLTEGREDEAIVEAIRWQEGLGFKLVTDGEFRRESWRLGFVTKVEGFARAHAVGDVDVQRDDAGNVARVGSAHQTVKAFRDEGLHFPSRLRAPAAGVIFRPLTASAAPIAGA
jgi:methionine synthase II (cobalamin-independent)